MGAAAAAALHDAQQLQLTSRVLLVGRWRQRDCQMKPPDARARNSNQMRQMSQSDAGRGRVLTVAREEQRSFRRAAGSRSRGGLGCSRLRQQSGDAWPLTLAAELLRQIAENTEAGAGPALARAAQMSVTQSQAASAASAPCSTHLRRAGRPGLPSSKSGVCDMSIGCVSRFLACLSGKKKLEKKMFFF